MYLLNESDLKPVLQIASNLRLPFKVYKGNNPILCLNKHKKVFSDSLWNTTII